MRRLPRASFVESATDGVSPASAGPVRDGARGTAASRRFLVFLAGRTGSLVGDAVWLLALSWAAANAGGPAATSLVLASGTIPRALLILLGGAVADRVGVRRLMMVSSVARVGLMCLGVAVAASDAPPLLVLVVLAATFGLVDALYHPSAGMVPRVLLRRDELSRGQALAQLGQRLADVVGAPLGGVLVAAGGFALACAFNASAFLLALCCLVALRLPRPPRLTGRDVEVRRGRGVLRELSEGLRYAVAEPLIRVPLFLVTALNALGSPVVALGVLLRVEREGWGVGSFAMFEAMFGLGAVAGSVAVARRGRVRQPALTGTRWATAQACSIAVVALAPTLPVMLAGGLAVGATAAPASAYLLGEVQARAAEAQLGRVMGLVGFSSVGLVPVAYAAYGFLAEVVPLPVLGGCLGALMLLACAVALGTGAVRQAA